MPHLKATNPCVDCLVFPICINIFDGLYPVNSQLFFHTLSAKCSLINDHLYHYNRGYIDGSRVVEAYNHFYEHSNLTEEQLNDY